ncbi:MAG: ATP-binding protein [Pirellula sp.]|nr:ATP-binding protein [Pirellula sp.]
MMNEKQLKQLLAKARAVLKPYFDPKYLGEDEEGGGYNQDRREKFDRNMAEVLVNVGVRLIDANLDNFETQRIEQVEALKVAKWYADSYFEVQSKGQNLIFFGGVGTGKDHLAMGIAKALYGKRRSVRWINGVTLQSRLRECIGGGETESEFIEELTFPDFLWMSDPVLPGCNLTPFVTQFIHNIVDKRYREKKPILMTVNVPAPKALEGSLGVPTVDRLRADAVTHFCNWPSYRKSENVDYSKPIIREPIEEMRAERDARRRAEEEKRCADRARFARLPEINLERVSPDLSPESEEILAQRKSDFLARLALVEGGDGDE